jgi:hypothetical protein
MSLVTMTLREAVDGLRFEGLSARAVPQIEESSRWSKRSKQSSRSAPSKSR